LREEEHETLQRDEWGAWAHSASEAFAAGTLSVPEIDRWVADRRRELAANAPLVPLWPRDATFAVCLLHDVGHLSRHVTLGQVGRALSAARDRASAVTPPSERARRLVRPAARLGRAVAGGIRSAPSTGSTVAWSADTLERLGVNASFFFSMFPGRIASRFDAVYHAEDSCEFRGRKMRVSDVMCELSAAGFDIGLHGSFASAFGGGSLKRERQMLEEATGLEVVTICQHYLRWEPQVTSAVQEAAGFRADATLGFNRAVGFRAGTSLPFRLYDAEGRRTRKLLELPVFAQDNAFLNSDSLDLDPPRARAVLAAAFDAVADCGGVLTVLVHPHHFERPEFRRFYVDLLVDGLERGAWFASLRAIESWWTEREAAIT
jgi:peptidoglycan/xylan/chitin deacetylase (PgdA/CDA1 family)